MALQFDAKPYCAIVAGNQGSGKSTFINRYMCADTSLCTRFVFDPEGEYSTRLNLPAATNEAELVCAAEDGFCIFDPTALYPGRNAEAFEFFCQWSFACAESFPGHKIFVVDEAWKYCSPNSVPESLSICIQTGRKRGLGMMFATQRPHLLNGSITNEATELVCFNLMEPKALERVQFLGADPAEISMLQPGNYVAINIKTRGILRGNVFARSASTSKRKR